LICGLKQHEIAANTLLLLYYSFELAKAPKTPSKLSTIVPLEILPIYFLEDTRISRLNRPENQNRRLFSIVESSGLQRVQYLKDVFQLCITDFHS